MWLKTLTSTLVAFGFLMIAGWYWVLGPAPKSRPQFVRYGERATIYTSVLIVDLIGAGIGSVLIMRQARMQYREAAMDNLKMLIEGTLRDHKSQEQPPEQPE